MSVITLRGCSSWRPPANQLAGRSATLVPPSPVRGQRHHDAQLAKITNVAHVRRSCTQAFHCRAFACVLALICGPFQLTGGQQLKKPDVGEKSHQKQSADLSSKNVPLMFFFVFTEMMSHFFFSRLSFHSSASSLILSYPTKKLAI